MNQQIGNPSGVLRAYDAITGQFAWAWDMGNPGYQGLPDEGGEYTRGTPNVWSNTAYDPVLNLIYAPTGNSSPDYFDGDLRSKEAEENSAAVVAIDAATGQRRWVYQTVHRDIWDWDVPSQPVLVDIRKNGEGELIPAVAQPTKRQCVGPPLPGLLCCPRLLCSWPALLSVNTAYIMPFE